MGIEIEPYYVGIMTEPRYVGILKPRSLPAQIKAWALRAAVWRRGEPPEETCHAAYVQSACVWVGVAIGALSPLANDILSHWPVIP